MSDHVLTGTGVRAVVPRQLPAAPVGFTGRTTELTELDRALPPQNDPGSVPTTWVIHGTGGVGKTWLTLRWAHAHAHAFPDGQLYLNLRGFGPSGAALDPAVAVRRVLEAFEVPAERIPEELDAQAALYRSVLAGKRVLIVLDNASEVEQVRPLLPGTSGCLALVTSRHQFAGLVTADGARSLGLDLLPDTEALDLLAARLGTDRVAAQPQAAREIIDRCAGLPLALALVAARCAAHPRFALADLAGELGAAAGGLEAFQSRDRLTDLRTVFSWSHRALTADAARVFRLLGLHPGPDIAAAAAASLAGLPPHQARRLLIDLTDANLITEHQPGRFAVHDLLRAYAAEQTHLSESAEQRRAATHRMWQHYLYAAHTAAAHIVHTAHAAVLLTDTDHEAIPLTPPEPGVTCEPVTDRDQAMAWLSTERAVMLEAIRQADGTDIDAPAEQLARTLTMFLLSHGHWSDHITTQQAALESARRRQDTTGKAHAHLGLGLGYARMGRFADAHPHLQQAWDTYETSGDRLRQALICATRTWDAQREARPVEALQHALQELALYQAAGHRQGEAEALNDVGLCHGLNGNFAAALDHCEQALALNQELGYRGAQAATWDSLGYAHRGLGNHERATACYQHAIDLHLDGGDRYNAADSLTSLGDAHHETGKPDDARKCWEQALNLFEQLVHPDAGRVRDKLAAYDGPPAPSHASIPDPAPATEDSARPAREHPNLTCVRHGQSWRLDHADHTALVQHSVGMLHLVVLIANPGKEIPALDLATGVASLRRHAATDTSPHPVLDQAALRDYRARVEHLRRYIDTLEPDDQSAHATQARAEHEWLITELAAATGINRRTRGFPDNPERARIAVSRAIRRAIDRISQADPHIGEHLQNGIHTGTRCSYRPLHP